MPLDSTSSTPPLGSPKRGELERNLGLPAAMAIGIGTMVGAGIFVFPGLAAGEAGAGATISFAIGALIALLVAWPASELATAMPYSGGAYVYVSRALGTFLGCIAGIGQWVGLVFASAFYLVGFGSYGIELLSQAGVPAPTPALVALVAAVLLAALNVAGTKNTGRFQNGIVASLLLILSVVLAYGLLSAFGIVGSTRLPEQFAPYGVRPIFSTAALVFTSYLGFVQIATVAGEVKSPERNLPRAMTGSVLVVGLLYVLTLFVCTTVLPPERLGELGETALVEVARNLLGTAGTVVVLLAGLLATLSSANASILSSSRAVYALSKDRVVPEQASVVNERFKTPHVALLAAGVPIAALTLLGRVEVLAEVASFLHLVLYALLCVALLVMRRRAPAWYAPSFRSPGYPLLPLAGAAASIGLIGFMQPLSQRIGAGVLAVVAVWYVVYARRLDLQRTEP